MAVGIFVAGLVLLFIGGEMLVRGAVGLARALRVSPLLIGLAVVALATSSPELFLSVGAVLKSAPDLAVGNVIGSNIANLMLVLAAGALLMPVRMSLTTAFREGTVLLAATGFLIYLGFPGSGRGAEMGPSAGLVMLGALLIYLLIGYLTERVHPTPDGIGETLAPEDQHPSRILPNLALVILGVVGLYFGAGFLIDGSISVAEILGVPEAVIAITMIAIGTSLPELATIMVAALRRHADVAVGAILGSNIFNVLAVLGITSLVEPVLISANFYIADMWVMLGAALFVIALMLLARRISRLAAAAMLAVYAGYIWWQFASQGHGF